MTPLEMLRLCLAQDGACATLEFLRRGGGRGVFRDGVGGGRREGEEVLKGGGEIGGGGGAEGRVLEL